MALAARLQLRQTQALVMTPQLLQSIRLLQLSHVELERFVEAEIEKNPLLERVDPRDDDAAVRAAAADREPGADAADAAETPAFTAEAMSERLDASLENVFPDDPGRGERPNPDLAAQWRSLRERGPAGAEGWDVDDLAAARPSLREHLALEIAVAFRNEADRLVAQALAGSLDDAGYLEASPESIAAKLGVSLGHVERVLAVCRRFEPAGLFARYLAECLELQLEAKKRCDPAMRAMLAHLELLARRDYGALARLCRVSLDDVLEMAAEIRALDPRPGAAFEGGSPADAVVPDVEVRAARDGGWTVEVNPATLPRVLVDNAYIAEVSAHTRDPEEKAFLSDCLQNASWLARSLDQRAKTILKVASEIVRQQDGFLVHGVRHLKPLNLRAVAEAIGMHESTVSRVTANKYMLTPRGVFELRYFFTAAIASSGGGDAHSSEAVRDRIRQLISEEKPAAVLSDDAIVEILKGSGVDIARRTVAKYREGMSIPSSVQRRREKRALAAVG